MMNVLITGFGPFGTEVFNPSGQVAMELDGQTVGGARVTGIVLPVSSRDIEAAFLDALAASEPQIVLALGLAAGRLAPSIERVAVNVRDFPIPDTDGGLPIDQPVVEGGPVGYFTDLPIKAIQQAWAAADLPGYVSNTAGTYLCNQLFYLACHHTRDRACRAGFLHIPSTPASARAASGAHPEKTPTMAYDDISRAVTVAIETAVLTTGQDIAVASGAVS
jgi:pyroglutamyl-peptidase